MNFEDCGRHGLGDAYTTYPTRQRRRIHRGRTRDGRSVRVAEAAIRLVQQSGTAKQHVAGVCLRQAADANVKKEKTVQQ